MDERFLNIDEYGKLKVPVGFWFGGAVLIRYFLLMLAVLLSGQHAGAIMSVMGGGIPWLAMAGEIFALAVMVAGANRYPNTGNFLRSVWRVAPWLLLATVVCNVFWFGWGVVKSGWDYSRGQWAMLGFALLDLCMAWVFTRSPFFRALFNEFPDPINGPKSDKNGH